MNPEPTMAIPEIFSVPVPVLVSVTATGVLFVLTNCAPNTSALGVSAAVAAADVPVPDRATVCGELAALSVTDSVAVLVPAPDGVKVTLIVHEAPDAKVKGADEHAPMVASTWLENALSVPVPTAVTT